MIKNIVRTSFILILLIWTPGHTQDFAPVGTAAAQFLEIGMGARATGMGEAFTAVTQNAGAVFWNPAGLVEVNDRNFFMAYNRWPADISVGGVSVAWNLGNLGVIGFNSVFISTDDMTVTTIDDPEGLSGETFALTNFSMGLSYARYLTNRLSVGATAKIVRENYMDYGYYSWAVDIGTVYKTGYRGLKLGMSILHFGQDIQFDGNYVDFSNPKAATGEERSFEKYSLPINFRVGLAMDVWESGQNKVISAVDMVHPNNNLEQYNWGLEYGFNQMFFFRTGYRFQIDEGGLTLGAGVKYQLFGDRITSLDYSFAERGIITDIHRLSVALSF